MSARQRACCPERERKELGGVGLGGGSGAWSFKTDSGNLGGAGMRTGGGQLGLGHEDSGTSGVSGLPSPELSGLVLGGPR